MMEKFIDNFPEFLVRNLQAFEGPVGVGKHKLSGLNAISFTREQLNQRDRQVQKSLIDTLDKYEKMVSKMGKDYDKLKRKYERIMSNGD